MDCIWEPHHDVCNPFVSRLLEVDKSHIQFKGYFLLEPGTVPIERIVRFPENYKMKQYHIEIIEIVKETEKFECEVCASGQPCDPEENHIQFFPSEIITLKFNTLTEIETGEYYRYACKRILEQEPDIQRRNETEIKIQQNQEREEIRKMDFSWLRNLKSKEEQTVSEKNGNNHGSSI